MAYLSVFQSFEENRNNDLAIKMAAYMKNNFLFLGINSPKRKLLQKEFLKQKIKSKVIDWDFIFICFNKLEREYQYLALDYLISLKKYVNMLDINKIEQLIVTKSWWDSVDGLDQVVGAMALKYPKIIDSHIRKWMHNENIWLVRVSINFQLEFREKTDQTILSEAIFANIGSKEFFINKAIGWSLREYSKWNKDWVANFVLEQKSILSPLSMREASKYL